MPARALTIRGSDGPGDFTPGLPGPLVPNTSVSTVAASWVLTPRSCATTATTRASVGPAPSYPMVCLASVIAAMRRCGSTCRLAASWVSQSAGLPGVPDPVGEGLATGPLDEADGDGLDPEVAAAAPAAPVISATAVLAAIMRHRECIRRVCMRSGSLVNECGRRLRSRRLPPVH